MNFVYIGIKLYKEVTMEMKTLEDTSFKTKQRSGCLVIMMLFQEI